jgi:hypothetical protein
LYSPFLASQITQLDLSGLHTQLANLLASGEAAATIEQLLRQPAQLDEVVSRSYAHPNGFRKLVVALPGNGTKLRVHHWPLGDSEPSNIHNHRWAFASAIVTGGMHSALFEAGEKGETVDRYVFEPSQAGGRYKLSPAGKRGISVTSIAELNPGTTYALSAEQLHQVHAHPDTLSLVLSGSAERDHTDVFRPATLDPQSRDLPLLPIDDVRESLELIVRELEAWSLDRSAVPSN